jgi:hypothetical protein
VIGLVGRYDLLVDLSGEASTVVSEHAKVGGLLMQISMSPQYPVCIVKVNFMGRLILA